MRGRGWKRSYSSMEGENDNTDIVDRIAFTRDLRAAHLAAYAQWMIDQAALEEEKKLRAKTVTKFQPKTNERSLFSYVMKVLASEKTGLHINDVIDKVSALGYQFKSKYHTYSQVYSIFSSNPSIFKKTKRATFTLRSGLIGEKTPKPAVARSASNRPVVAVGVAKLSIPSTKDVVRDLAQTGGITNAIEMYYALLGLGVSISYATTKKHMKEIEL